MTSVLTMPAPSVAVIVIVLFPTTSGTDADHDVVPVAGPVEPPPSARVQETEATEMLSDAVPESVRGVTLVTYVGAAVGPVIVMPGGVPSRVTVMRSVELLPALSVTVRVMGLAPGLSGMPVSVQVSRGGRADPLPPVAELDHP